jgi:hypothetical protein
MPENSFADAARARKVAAMVRYFDRRFIAVGRCPYREAAELATMLRESVSDEQWKHHAVLAGQKKPSVTSIALIIAEYEKRAAERAEPTDVLPIRKYGGVN